MFYVNTINILKNGSFPIFVCKISFIKIILASLNKIKKKNEFFFFKGVKNCRWYD